MKYLKGTSVAVLMYHAVVREPFEVEDWCFLHESEFTRQMRWLRGNFDVVPLSALVHGAPAHGRPRVAITFDDGFRNVADVAFPVLESLGLPATVFLATDFIGSDRYLWYCDVYRAVARTRQEVVDFDGRRFDLGSGRSLAQAAADIQALLKNEPQPVLLRKVAGLCKALGMKEQAGDAAIFGCMTEEHVTRLRGSGLIDFGAHSCSHPILSSLKPEEQRREIERSVERVAQVTGVPCRLFAYPNGRAEDYTPDCLAFLEEARVDVALTTLPGLNAAGRPMLELRRVGVGADTTLDQLRDELTPLLEDGAPLPRTSTLVFVYRVCGLGGVETSILAKAAALKSCGVRVFALFLGYWGEGGRELAAANPEVAVVEEDRGRQLEFLRKVAPDAVVVVDTPEFFEALSHAGIASDVYFESHMSYEPSRRACYPQLAGKALSGIFVPSAFNARKIAPFAGDVPITVVPNPAAVDAVSASPPPVSWNFPPQPLVAWVGRIEDQKNPMELLEIASVLLQRKRGLHFVIVGDAVDTADYAQQVRARIAAIGNEHFSVIPRIPHADMGAFLELVAHSGGCLVGTSRNESQPMVFLEAMARGCPVVSTNVGGVPELISDGETGLLFRPGDTAAAAQLIESLLQADAAPRITRAARVQVRRNHHPAAAAQRYLATLAWLREEEGGTRDNARQGTRKAMTSTETKRALPPAAGAEPSAALDATSVGSIMGRLDSLLAEVMRLRGEVEELRRHDAPLSKALVGLFTQNVDNSQPRLLKPYEEIAPNVRVAFQEGAQVMATVSRKDDFSRSPDFCLNTVSVQFSGKSDWMTVEFPIGWEDVERASSFQLEIHSEQDRMVESRVVLRAISGESDIRDHGLASCSLSAGPGHRSISRGGALELPPGFRLSESSELRVLIFFDTSASLTIRLDYMSLYFV